MIVLDTTVLVYAKGAAHPLRDPCRALISAVAERRLQATTTVEVIQEFAHVRAKRRDRDDAAALARDYAELLAPLLTVDRDHLEAGLRIFREVDDLGAFDAVLAACAAASGAEAVVSADRAFRRAPGIRHVVPDELGVAQIL